MTPAFRFGVRHWKIPLLCTFAEELFLQTNVQKLDMDFVP